MARPAGRIKNILNCRGSTRVGSGGARNFTGRVRSLSKLRGRVGSGLPQTDTNREKRPVKSPGKLGAPLAYYTLVQLVAWAASLSRRRAAVLRFVGGEYLVYV